MSNPAALALFAGLSVNLLLHIGVGLRDFTREPEQSWVFLILQSLFLAFSIVLLWLLFTYIVTPLSLGFLEYSITLPILAVLFRGVGLAAGRSGKGSDGEFGIFSAISGEHNVNFGVVMAAFFITLTLAQSIYDALVLSFSFSWGSLFSVLVVKNIHRRISLERLPRFLRGLPLLLVSIGFLALISSAISSILF